MNPDSSPFSNEVRVRSCGLLVESGSVLLAQIASPVNGELVWMPPGGGVELGESLEECLKREFSEETGLDVKVGPLIHVDEMISLPFHAIELFFEISRMNGELKIGSDPELGSDNQLLRELKWHSIADVNTLNIAPDGILQKLQNWKNRSSLTVF